MQTYGRKSHDKDASNESIVSYVLSTRQKLQQMRDIVKENLEYSQDLQKLWYDKKVVSRSSVKEIKLLFYKY